MNKGICLNSGLKSTYPFSDMYSCRHLQYIFKTKFWKGNFDKGIIVYFFLKIIIKVIQIKKKLLIFLLMFVTNIVKLEYLKSNPLKYYSLSYLVKYFVQYFIFGSHGQNPRPHSTDFVFKVVIVVYVLQEK